MNSILRLKVWLSSVASILSKTASAMSCSAARISSQSPAAASMPCISALRPKFAATPKAAPARAAPSNGPALSLHEKALRLPCERLLVDERLWVRVAIDTSLSWLPIQRSGQGAVPVENALKPLSVVIASKANQSSGADLDCHVACGSSQ